VLLMSATTVTTDEANHTLVGSPAPGRSGTASRTCTTHLTPYHLARHLDNVGRDSDVNNDRLITANSENFCKLNFFWWVSFQACLKIPKSRVATAQLTIRVNYQLFLTLGFPYHSHPSVWLRCVFSNAERATCNRYVVNVIWCQVGQRLVLGRGYLGR
jgi:hypothetical protein